MTRPALIVNPKAKQLARTPSLLNHVRATARGRADVFEPSTLEELNIAVRRIVDADTPALMLVGGDGTTMAGLTALARVSGDRPWPIVALAHAGTVGTIARGLGFRGRLRTSVDRFCAGAMRTPFDQPTLCTRADALPERIGFIFATGFVARYFERYDEAGGGTLAAASLAARLFAGAFVGTELARQVLAPMPCRVAVDGAPLEPEAWGVIVSSVLPSVGLGVRVTYRGAENPDKPHLVATPLGPRGLGLNFPRVLAGRPVLGRGTFDSLVDSFRVTWEEPGPWVLDGDTVRSTRVEVRAGPCVRMAHVR